MNTFNEIKPEDIRDNPFKLIGGDWMLITAGDLKSFNTMTASWGSLGVLWEKNVAFCFVRPTRYTYEFMNRHEAFSLSFFPKEFRNVLTYCGSHSGKQVNKVAHCGITPAQGSMDDVYFTEARMVLECRKIYFSDINPSAFLDQTLADIYPEKDYHRMFIGEIVRALEREMTKSNK
jgi:flavin reductase (DIM6/NTAB) family NADH-FMN oxidoreductase RutF